MSQQFLKHIQRGQAPEVAEAVEADPSLVTFRDAQGVSALMWAIYSGQTTIRNFLLVQISNQGVPLDLFEAAAVGDTAEIEAALETSLTSAPSQLIQLTPESPIQNYSPTAGPPCTSPQPSALRKPSSSCSTAAQKLTPSARTRRRTSRSTPP